MLSLAVFAGLSAVFIIPPLLVEIATDLDVSVAVAGQLATATFAAWTVSLVCVGPLSDSFGRRPVALTGLVVLSVSVLASAFAPNIEALLALRMLTGLAGGTLPPTAVGVVSDVISPSRRAQAVTAVLALNGVVSATTVPLVAVLAEWGSWRHPFIVVGLTLALGLLANWIWFPKDSKERVRSLRVLLPVSVAALVALFPRSDSGWHDATHRFLATLSFFPAHLILAYDVALGLVALPLVITAIGQVVGSYSAAYVAKNRYRAALVAGTSVAGGICAFLFFSFHLGLWLSVAVVAVGTGLLSVAMPAMVAASTEYSGESKSTGASLMGLSNQSGGALGAAIAGACWRGTGYAGIGYLCLGATIASGLMTPLFGKQFGEAAGRIASAPGSAN